MNTLPVRVNRRALLSFMNEGALESQGHHTAIIGLLGEPLAVALILHYLRTNGRQPSLKSMKVTQGTVSGPRLDAWIFDGVQTLYQTEIKMWAGNAIGGLRLKAGADENALRAGGIRQWERIWNDETRSFRDSSVGKVLKVMRPPVGLEGAKVEPLACFWWMVQKQGGSPPWFTVLTASPPFAQVNIFSLTAYLLTLSDDELVLDMPLLAQRLDLLDRIIQR